MANRVFVTGIGIICAIGNNAGETLASLQTNRSGIQPLTILDTIYRGELPAGEIKLTNEQLAEMAGITDLEMHTRTALLGMIAAGEALKDAGIDPKDSHFRTGISSASTVGGMDRTEINYRNYHQGAPYSNFILTHGCNDHTEKIAVSYGFRDMVTTMSTACSSSANSIMFGTRLIRHGIIDRVLAGGTDALSKFTLNGFNTLMILDKKPCRPFDKNRMGLNLGEGAAFLVLESEKALRDRTPLCELSGFANANDAYHQTASSPDGSGPFLSMSRALESCGLKPCDIDYVNAHGTGTDNNDFTEGIAIERVFGKKIPYVSSTKPFTGHTLGAAGAVEAVISVLSITNSILFPNLNFREKIDELSFEPLKEMVTGIRLKHVLSNSFGFGGNDSTLILSSC
ncbi:MAG TPA: beta-ketoacyl-[acyl-carrier-protein] synthase family protein [Bacteroidales bacterium]|nr:beta-ketoacyl-[acyl-carrier-protein] synthase family protein [Bacteroidales bacterium]HNS46106.1 beta-ketoacyl-[acyl-carrier-protein] synthase family protein [Bacteroidales bacterium]